MKQYTTRTLLIFCLISIGLMMSKSISAQTLTAVPDTYTTIPNGYQTINSFSLTGTDNWFKWTIDSSQISIDIKLLTSNGKKSIQLARLYIEHNGSWMKLLDQQYINPADSTINFYRNKLLINKAVYLNIVTEEICGECSNEVPTTKLVFAPMGFGCTYTHAPCELVRDGGMEAFTACSSIKVSGEFGDYLPTCHWSLPNSNVFPGSSDYFNTCAATNIPGTPGQSNSTNANQNFHSMCASGVGPHSGNGYLGAILYSNVPYNDSAYREYREYIVNHLTSPMIAGKTYSISMYVRLSNASKYATHHISMLLSNMIPTQSFMQLPGGTISTTIPVTSEFIPTFNSYTPITNKSNWTLLSMIYTPNTTNNYITIGNFTPSVTTVSSLIDLNPSNTWTYNSNNSHIGTNCTDHDKRAYYYFDDVSIKPLEIHAGPDKSICSGNSTTLTSTINCGFAGSSVSYSWTPSASLTTPGASSTSASPTVTTNYTVTATVTFTNGSPPVVLTDQVTVTVTNAGSFSLTASANPNPICLYPGSTTTLSTNAGTNLSYTWTNGVNTYTVPNPVVSPTVTTTYTVTTVNCSQTFTAKVTVTVNPSPAIQLNSNSICFGSAVSVSTSTGNTITYLDFGDPTSLSNFVNPHYYNSNGNYSITVHTSSGACNSQTVIPITVTTATSSSISYSPQPCSYTYTIAQVYNCTSITDSNTVEIFSAASPTTSIFSNDGNFIPAGTFTFTFPGPGTYTVVAYSSADGFSSPTISTVTIPAATSPTVSISASPSATICAGNSVTLTASGATSYSWNTGATTNSIVVAPSVTTSYTVIGTNSLGCAATKTITITVVSNFTLTASASSSVICSSQSVSLTASGAPNYTWMPGSITTSTTVVSPTVPTIYTVTSTNSGCTHTQTVSVSVTSYYCCQSPVKTFTTGNWSAQTASTTVSSDLIAITGTVTINVNTTFNLTIVRMDPNAQIIVAPGITLTLSGAHLFSCDYLWEGIVLSDGSTLAANRTPFPNIVNPTLDDAKIGIYANASGMTTAPSISLSYLQLSKSHIGVKIENYAGTTAYPFSMASVTMQGNMSSVYSPGTAIKPHIVSGVGTVYYPSMLYGVNLVNVNAARVGNASTLRNTFRNMYNCVRMLNSNAHVSRIDFKDFSSGYDNKAIWAVGSYVNANPTSSPYISFGTKYRFHVGTGASNNCTFTNLKNGVFADSCMTSYIVNNTFNDIYGTGISIYRSNYYYGIQFNNGTPPMLRLDDRDTTKMTNNTMKPVAAGINVMQNGIGMYDNYYLHALSSTNSMTLNPASNVWGTGVGIYHGAQNHYSAYSTTANKIIGNGNYGVHEVNNAYLPSNLSYAGGTRIINTNSITVGTGYCSSGFNTPNVEVHSVNSPYATIKENIIDETSLGGAPSCMIGIYISNGQQDVIGCNLMKNNSISCTVDQNNVNSTYRGNVMDGALVGLYRVNGTMGDVGAVNDAAQNEWYNTPNNTFVANSFVASNIFYDSGTGRNPVTNGQSLGTAFLPILTTTTTLGCTQYHRGGNYSDINPKEDNDDQVSEIINGTILFPKYNESLLWEHKNGILNLLKDSLLNNNKIVFKQFRLQQTNTNLGKINSLMRSLGNYADVVKNKNTYLQQLNAITTNTNVVEQNYQLFINEYINNIAGALDISRATYNNIKQLAQKCPYSDGAVVYNARALMKIWGDNEVYHNVCEVMEMPVENTKGKITGIAHYQKTENVMVYPNPNNGSFTIAYSFEQTSHTFELYDLMGKKVTEKILNGNEGVENIKLTTTNNGIYFYKVFTDNGKMLFTGKLIISK